jgi:hypothetical protein
MDLPACEMPTMTGGGSMTDMVGHESGMSAQQDMSEAMRPAHAAILHRERGTPPMRG